ncbi:OmpP1/FadL family transporter [Faecalibacter rhinopitheci]|uniref:Hemin receptor n=1 Tax=Faecalibacter rhinopitheci TaxID=2779678 RepID=A0A8J7FQW0_9FLAO|nr:hypothetical protein [Faecalibacter rhinopitheci]MBF0596713.1 hypothetical protein [Faecalibacter rhinopitheci]
MKKIFINILVLGSGLVYAQEQISTQYSTNAIELYGQDINSGNAKYIGVGGAVGALGGDISSVEQNPAGLGVAINSDVQVTAGVSTYKNSNSFSSNRTEKDSNFDFQHFGGTFVFNINDSDWNRFSIGVNYLNQRLDRVNQVNPNSNIAFDAFDENGQLTNTYRFHGYADQIDGYKSKFSLNFATAYDNKLYLGLGLNFHETNYQKFSQYAEKTDNGNTYVYDLNGTPYSEIGQGFSLSAGAIYKFNYNFRAGLAYHSPVWYNVDEQYFAANFTDAGDISSYNAYGSNYDLTRGGRLVGSLGFVVDKNFSFGVDYTYHMNDGTKFKPTSYFNLDNSFIDQYVNNSSEIRVGGEYRIDKFKARLGYNFIESPYKDINLDIADVNNIVSSTTLSKPFVGDINRFSAGLGYDFGGFYIDAAYQYQTQKAEYLIGNSTFVDNDLYYVDLENTYAPTAKLNNSLFLLTLGWQF